MALLEVDDLRVTFNTPRGPVRAVRGVSVSIERGEILGVVGESGCGKSVTFRALLGLTPASATIDGSMQFDGRPMDTDGPLRSRAAMIYQNPGAALNPVFTIGQQLEVVAGTKDTEALAELLDQVGLPDPEKALTAYPHEYSGGMRQRAVIALALAQNPDLLVADEPTTALDVTTQAQILDLIRDIRDDRDLSVAFVSHDLAVVRQLCDSIAVLYAGRVVESGATEELLGDPRHPYTQALLDSTPRPENIGKKLASIPGLVPDGRSEIVGCAYAERCPHATDRCRTEQPQHRSAGGRSHSVACILVEDQT